MANPVQTAIQNLESGKIVGLPTETVYGLAVDAMNRKAVQWLHEVKGRPANKPLQIMVEDLEAAEKLAVFDDRARRIAKSFWPGPLTLILPRQEECRLPEEISGGKPNLGIRIPDQPLMQEVLRLFARPIVVTSANPAGQAPANEAAVAEAMMGGNVGYYLYGFAGVGLASTVADLTGREIKILREGAITLAQLQGV